MDSKRFDNWTRNRALRLSRRDALRLAGAGGAVAFAARSVESLAQPTCSLTFRAETAAGPSAPAAYEGTLQFTLGTNGALSQASFAPPSGGSQPATGRATGRAIDIQIALPGNQVLSLSGVADRPLSSCPASAAGILSGPQPGDLGAWQATSSNAPAAPVTTSGQITTNPPPAGSSCPAPQVACGPNCCPAGATCTDVNQGTCFCPAGTAQCGLSCVPNCPAGQTLDPNSCSCTVTCSPDRSPCQFDAECCGGFCDITSATCTTCAGLVCGEMGCVDPSTDPFNCGACGNVCVDDTGFCLGGACQCIPDGEPKGSSSSSCCSQSYVSTTGLCGCAQIGEGCDSTGECCDNPSGAICTFAKQGGFEACCWQTGHACGSDADCCFDAVCSNGACTAVA